MLLYRVGEKSALYVHLAQLTEEQIGADKTRVLQELPLELSLKNIDDLDELAILLVDSWGEKSGELAGVRFLTNKELTTAELKKVGSY